LIHQFHLNPDIVKMKLDAQASAIREERSGVLAKLRRHAPKFTELVDD
jgi:hypothetical protein